MCSLRHDRRVFVPCFSSSHSPEPQSFSPVLSTSRCTGPEPGRGRTTSRLSARRLKRCMVRHGEIEAEQGDDGADQPFGLPQRQAEHRPQRQRRRDGQGRIARLAASRRSRLSLPGRDRRVGEPDRQAAALTQGCIVGRRVRGPMPLLWDVVATLGIGFERHDNHPGQ